MNKNYAAQHKFSLSILSKQIKRHYFTPLLLTVSGILSNSAFAQSNQTEAFYLVDANGNHLLDANGQKVVIYTMPSDKGTALGQGAKTNDEKSVAIGIGANANNEKNNRWVDRYGHGAVAIGENANASSTSGAIAIGADADAVSTETGSGPDPQNHRGENIAIGVKAKSKSFRSIAIGHESNATGEGSVVLGNYAKASNLASVAVGQIADASGLGGTAIGNNATASATYSTALGTSSKAKGVFSNTLGTFATTAETAYAGTAIGLHANAKGRNAIAIGRHSTTSSDNTDGMDTIAIGTVSAAYKNAGTALGYSAIVDGKYSSALGALSLAAGLYTTAVGPGARSFTTSSVALGQTVYAGGDAALRTAADNYYYTLEEYNKVEQDIAFTSPNASSYAGKKTKLDTLKTQVDNFKAIYEEELKKHADNTHTVAIGSSSFVDGKESIVVGASSQITAKNATAIGTKNKITAQNTQVLGNNVTADIENSVYLGNDTTAVKDTGQNTKIVRTPSQTTPGETEVTIEQGNTTTGGATGTVSEATINGVTYGNFAGATAKGGVSVGSADNERRIMNVAAGEISKTSTDAINGSQLYAVMNAPFWSFKVDGDTTNGSENMYIGNELVFKAGSGITLTRTGKELTINSTAQAGAGTQGPKGEDGSSVTVKSVQTTDGNTTVTLTDKNGDKSFVVKKGEDGLKKEIKAGLSGNVTVEDKGTHYEVDTKNLVNVNQFNNVEQRMTNIEHRVNKVSREMRGIGANVAAGISLPQAFLPGKTMIAASAGTYKDASAVAVGYSRVSDSGNVTIKFTGTANSVGDISGGVGMGYQY